MITGVASSQNYTLKNSDSTVAITNLGAKYEYTFLYFTSTRGTGTDSVKIYNYVPSLNTWIPSKLINLTMNTETTAGSIIPLSSQVVYAFYELYLHGIKIVRTNWVHGNDTTLYVFVKNIGGN